METAEFLEDQRALQLSIGELLPLTRTEQRERAKVVVQYLIEEVYEYLESISYKHWVPESEAPRNKRLTELIDIQRYLYYLALLEDVTSEEWEETFKAKGQTIVRRHKHRQQNLDGLIVTIDLDGVLAEYVDWGEDVGFIETGGVQTIKPRPGAHIFLRWLLAQGWLPVVLTSRKRRQHPRLESDTVEWLAQNNLDVAGIIWEYDKAEAVADRKVLFHIDDSAKHAIDMAALTRVYKFPHTGENDRLNFNGELPQGVRAVSMFTDIVIELIRDGVATWNADVSLLAKAEGQWPDVP